MTGPAVPQSAAAALNSPLPPVVAEVGTLLGIPVAERQGIRAEVDIRLA